MTCSIGALTGATSGGSHLGGDSKAWDKSFGAGNPSKTMQNAGENMQHDAARRFSITNVPISSRTQIAALIAAAPAYYNLSHHHRTLQEHAKAPCCWQICWWIVCHAPRVDVPTGAEESVHKHPSPIFNNMGWFIAGPSQFDVFANKNMIILGFRGSIM